MKYALWIFGTLAFTGLVLFAYIAYNSNDDTDSAQTSSESSSGVTDTTNTDKNTLDLSNQGLTKVDSSIYSKTNTTVLILSNNSIKSLPSEMGKMTKLITLRLDKNLIEGSLIGEIRQMSQLQTLDASYNNMTGIPAEMGQLSKLQTLDLSYNGITGLPNELKDLKNNLKEFDLTGNPLSEQQIAELRASLPNTVVKF